MSGSLPVSHYGGMTVNAFQFDTSADIEIEGEWSEIASNYHDAFDFVIESLVAKRRTYRVTHLNSKNISTT